MVPDSWLSTVALAYDLWSHILHHHPTTNCLGVGVAAGFVSPEQTPSLEESGLAAQAASLAQRNQAYPIPVKAGLEMGCRILLNAAARPLAEPEFCVKPLLGGQEHKERVFRLGTKLKKVGGSREWVGRREGSSRVHCEARNGAR